MLREKKFKKQPYFELKDSLKDNIISPGYEIFNIHLFNSIESALYFLKYDEKKLNIFLKNESFKYQVYLFTINFDDSDDSDDLSIFYL